MTECRLCPETSGRAKNNDQLEVAMPPERSRLPEHLAQIFLLEIKTQASFGLTAIQQMNVALEARNASEIFRQTPTGASWHWRRRPSEGSGGAK
jgi:hypothetical protein